MFTTTACRRVGRSVAMLVTLASLSCAGEDAFAPTPESVAGTYQATAFLINDGVVTHDAIALGGSLTLTLTAAGHAVTGSLDIPTSIAGGLQASMDGSFTVSGGSLRFQQNADTFVRDVAWLVSSGRIAYTGPAGGGSSVSVQLVRGTL